MTKLYACTGGIQDKGLSYEKSREVLSSNYQRTGKSLKCWQLTTIQNFISPQRSPQLQIKVMIHL
jgi:hypothetical protein